MGEDPTTLPEKPRSLAESSRIVRATEERLRSRTTARIAELVGREEAERLSSVVYSREEPHRVLSAYEASLIERFEKGWERTGATCASPLTPTC